MSEEIQRADARHRMRFLVAMMVVALSGAVGLLQLDAYLLDLENLAAQTHPLAAEKTLRVVHSALGLLAAGVALFSFHFGRISWRALRSERFPPPGVRVISDTRIHRGAQARRRGQAGLAIAALTVLLTAVVAWRADRLFHQLLSTTLKPTTFVPADR